MTVRVVITLVLSIGLVGCGGSDDPSPDAATTEGGDAVMAVDVAGHSLEIECSGAGSPTIVLVSGLNTDRSTWDGVVPELASRSRVCSYDRAGLGNSDPSGGDSVTAGSAAAELRGLLDGAEVEPPYVLVGHSYGGMIAREFAAGNRSDVVGLGLVDSAVPEQFDDPFFADIEWAEAGVAIDTSATAAELDKAPSLDGLPLVVLTQGLAQGAFKRLWSRYQDGLAALSDDSVHVLALSSEHFIQEQQPALVIEAADDLVTAARSGVGLDECDSRYTDLDAECV